MCAILLNGNGGCLLWFFVRRNFNKKVVGLQRLLRHFPCAHNLCAIWPARLQSVIVCHSKNRALFSGSSNMSTVMRKFSKHNRRRGSHPTKVLFTIEVLNLTKLLPALTGIGDEAVLSVCFERWWSKWKLMRCSHRGASFIFESWVGNILYEAVYLNHFIDFCFDIPFFRGGKMSCSTGIHFDSSPSAKGSLEVKQTLSLVATLYQEASGEFQEKTAKLILRQSKVSYLMSLSDEAIL